jgi:hypothetical protein
MIARLSGAAGFSTVTRWIRKNFPSSTLTIFGSIGVSDAERMASRPGDALVMPGDVVMDRAFTVDAQADEVWPWLLQLGKRRAGWYLPRRAERFIPRSRRASRSVNPAWLNLSVGDVVPDYGGRHETFEVAAISPPASLAGPERGRTAGPGDHRGHGRRAAGAPG